MLYTIDIYNLDLCDNSQIFVKNIVRLDFTNSKNKINRNMIISKNNYGITDL